MITMLYRVLLVATFLVMGSVAASSSPGPVDANGCHFSEAQGYHCHP